MEVVHSLKDLVNPSLSRRKQTEFEAKAETVVWDEADFEEPKDHWYMQEVTVAPEWQKMGVG